MLVIVEWLMNGALNTNREGNDASALCSSQGQSGSVVSGIKLWTLRKHSSEMVLDQVPF